MFNRSVLSQLVHLSKSTSPSSTTGNDVIKLTLTAFEQKKPLFKAGEKAAAVAALQKSLPLFEPAYRQLNIGMNLDRRQKAQISRSGLQFLADEMQDVPEIQNKFDELLTSRHVKDIETYIENTVGMRPENVGLKNIDLATIPQSHYWWFYPEEVGESE